jgi:endonuclease V-like protein UPF0215 family
MPGCPSIHYVDEQPEWEKMKKALRTIPRAKLAKMSGLHVRSIKAILNTSRMPHRNHRAILWGIAETHRIEKNLDSG